MRGLQGVLRRRFFCDSLKYRLLVACSPVFRQYKKKNPFYRFPLFYGKVLKVIHGCFTVQRKNITCVSPVIITCCSPVKISAVYPQFIKFPLCFRCIFLCVSFASSLRITKNYHRFVTAFYKILFVRSLFVVLVPSWFVLQYHRNITAKSPLIYINIVA